MFLKPFKVKSNTKIKSSERKKFSEQVQKSFALSDEEVARVIGKTEIHKMKLLTHSEAHVFVYTCNQQPVVIDIDGLRIPTVYTLWEFPQLLPTFTTQDAVIPRLQNGADLMLPGVRPMNPPGLKMYGDLPKGLACAVNTTTNRSPIAIGYTAMSCSDMYMSAGRGKAVIISHIIGDELWAIGDRSKPPLLPWLTPADPAESEEEEEEEEAEGAVGEASVDEKGEEDGEEEMSREVEEKENEENEEVEDGAAGEEDEKTVPSEEEEEEEEEVVALTPDELLMDCFLHALRLSVKDKLLPMPSNILYGKHVLSFVGPNERLDVKKTLFKKFSAFLNYMADEGLVKVENGRDGVQTLLEVCRSHDRLTTLEVHRQIPVAPEAESASASSRTVLPPVIEEVWFIVDKVLPFFSPLGFKKGDALPAGEIKRLLTDYVRDKKLQSAEDRSVILLDPILSQVLFRGAPPESGRLLYRELQNRLQQQMTAGYSASVGDSPAVCKRGQVPRIQMRVESRGGRKQVTLIAGVEAFRIELPELARAIQHGRACSATVTEDKRGVTVVQAQGDQRAFVGCLLTETYQLPKKYIESFDEIVSKKKKKKKR